MFPYYTLSYSYIPIFIAFSLFFFFFSLLFFFYYLNSFFIWISLLLLVIILLIYFYILIIETLYLGYLTNIIKIMIKHGFILFIISEVMLFSGFLASYYNILFINSFHLPYYNLFNVFSIPLLNTLLLLISGVSLTCSHYIFLYKYKTLSLFYLLITILLGLFFLSFQFIEYNLSFFSIADGWYGALFFLITGFHGLHVFVGLIFLIYVYVRMYFSHFNLSSHLLFEFAIWYWHFVDVVWIFVYFSLYYLVY